MVRQGLKQATKGGNGRKKVEKKNKVNFGSSQVNYTVEDLVEKAEELLDQYEPDTAQKFYEKAMQMDPNHIQLLDSYAHFLLDMDDFNAAKQLLVKSIQLAPNDNWVKYMSLGQILQGGEAVQCYHKGIQLMTEHKRKLDNGEVIAKEGEVESIKEQIASALCCQAELYMTDSCYEDNAESECEKLLAQALQVDPNNKETLFTMANFKLCQQKQEEALHLLNQSYALWKDLDYSSGLWPSMEFCHNSAKMFLELSEDKTAASIWENLLEIDDNIAEIHYHLGLAYRYTSSEVSLECLNRAKELLAQCSDPALLKQVEDIIASVLTEDYREEADLAEEDSKEEQQDPADMDV